MNEKGTWSSTYIHLCRYHRNVLIIMCMSPPPRWYPRINIHRFIHLPSTDKTTFVIDLFTLYGRYIVIKTFDILHGQFFTYDKCLMKYLKLQPYDCDRKSEIKVIQRYKEMRVYSSEIKSREGKMTILRLKWQYLPYTRLLSRRHKRLREETLNKTLNRKPPTSSLWDVPKNHVTTSSLCRYLLTDTFD